MAVIGKIREKSTLLLIMIGGAMLLFILGDIASSGGSILRGNQTVVGEVDGETVDIRDFQIKVEESVENYKANYEQANVDAATQDAIRAQTWDQMVREMILGAEREELGVALTTDELVDMITGPNPDPRIVQAFTDRQTGRFNPAEVSNYVRNMDSDETGKSRAMWDAFVADMKKQRVSDKYFNLIRKGLYVTSVEAENDYVANNKRVDIRYVAKRYISMPDSAVSVSDSDLKKYYDSHKYKYKQEESREIEFVSFDVRPSQDDIDEVRTWIEEVATEFETVEDDTLYITEQADPGKEYRPIWRVKADIPDGLDTVLYDASVGTMHGPYRVGDTYKVVKLLGAKMAPDSVQARHILLQPETQNDTEESLKAKADSLKQLIKSGQAKFEDLAMRLSKDGGSAQKGGDLGWFGEGMMVAPFNNAAFSGSKGDMPIVVTQFGIHLIEITDVSSKSKKVNLGFIERDIVASDKTYQSYYTKADQFARENNTAEKFEAAVVEQGLNKRVPPPMGKNDAAILGMDNSRQAVKWAYESEVGDVSRVFDLGDKFIVAVVSDVKEKGFATLESVKPEVEAEVRKDKKAEKFIAEFNSALGSAKDISAIGTAVNAPAEAAQGVNFGVANIPGLGREPELVGTVVTMQAGQVSKPIKGKNGVFVAVVDNVYEAPAAQNYAMNKMKIANNLANREGEIYEALKEKANVVDNRSKFY